MDYILNAHNFPISGCSLCKTCANQCRTSGTGKPTYGLISDRKNHIDGGSTFNSWRDPTGKIVTPYSKVIAKMGITRGEAEKEAARLGWSISEEHFETLKRSAGRPKNLQ